MNSVLTVRWLLERIASGKGFRRGLECRRANLGARGMNAPIGALSSPGKLALVRRDAKIKRTDGAFW